MNILVDFKCTPNFFIQYCESSADWQ